MHLRVKIVRLTVSCQRSDKILTRGRFDIGEWRQEVLLVGEAKHGEPFRADYSELLVPAV